jgi:hypothetical protein
MSGATRQWLFGAKGGWGVVGATYVVMWWREGRVDYGRIYMLDKPIDFAYGMGTEGELVPMVAFRG